MQKNNSPVYNVLLLSETMEAKTAFIQAMHFYTGIPSLYDALQRPLNEMPRISFSATDKRGQIFDIVGLDTLTWDIPTFYMKLRNITLKIVDGSGINCSAKSIEELCNYLTDSKIIHKVCILFNTLPDIPSHAFNVRIQKIMENLEGELVKNTIIACFNPKCILSAFDTYVPTFQHSDPVHDVHKLIQAKLQLPVEFDNNNVFSINVKPFAYVIAKKSHVTFSPEQNACYDTLWNLAADQINRLRERIVENGNHGLTVKTPDGAPTDSDDDSAETIQPISAPMNIPNSFTTFGTSSMVPASVELKRKIQLLIRPLMEALELLQYNIHLLRYFMHIFETNYNNPDVVKNYGYIPKVTKAISICLTPKLVCKSEKCANVKTALNLTYIEFPQICLIDSVNLHKKSIRFCEAIQESTGNCTICGCHYKCHMVKKYNCDIATKKTKPQMKWLMNSSDEGLLAAADSNFRSLKEQLLLYESQEDYLMNFMAQLTNELKRNSMDDDVDTFHKYICKLHTNEMILKNCGADNSDIIQRLQKFLDKYNSKLISIAQNERVNPSEFYAEVEIMRLKRLPIIGKLIEDIDNVLAEFEESSQQND